jgi:VWFA-related protein
MTAFLLVALLAAAAPPPLFTNEAEQVRLDVSVARHGEPLKGLEAAAFEVRDNGAVQSAAVASREESAVHGVLVLDLSTSLGAADRAALKTAAAAFLHKLEPDDHATVLTFTNELRLIEGPGDAASALAALERLPSDCGSTALYDALYAGLTVAGAAAGRPFVLVFTDGQDQISWLAPRTLLLQALRFEATVYVVSTGTWTEASGLPSSSRNVLRQLVQHSGGRLLTGRTRDDFERDFTRVLAEVKNRYLLVYDAPGKPGWHDVSVRLKKTKGEVRTRRGYFSTQQDGRP